MPYRVVKQLKPAPTSSVDRHGKSMTDPGWASRNVYVAKLSGSADQLWEFSGSNALSGYRSIKKTFFTNLSLYLSSHKTINKIGEYSYG